MAKKRPSHIPKSFSSSPISLTGKAASNLRKFIYLWQHVHALTWEQYLACGNKLAKQVLLSDKRRLK